MVADLRAVEKTLGSGGKLVSEVEMTTRRKYHVSIVSATDIPTGEVIERAEIILEQLLARRDSGSKSA